MMYRSCAFAILVILGLSADVALAGKFVGLEVGTRYIRSHWLYPTEIILFYDFEFINVLVL